MVTRSEEAFAAFVRVWSGWWSRVPDRLARQESSLVVRLLTLGLQEGGISQAELKRELRIAQPRLSKLMVKLEKVGWIQMKASKTDRRIKLMTTTVKARGRVNALKQDLAILLQAQGARQTPTPVPPPKPPPFRRGNVIRQQPGQTGFFDENGDPVGLDQPT